MNTALDVPVRQIVELLVAAEYKQIASITGGQRLDDRSIREAIHDYGRTIIMPPDAAFEQMDVVPVIGAHPARWSVRMNLWTAEEGRSDLSVEMTLIEAKDGYDIEMDDIHVL